MQFQLKYAEKKMFKLNCDDRTKSNRESIMECFHFEKKKHFFFVSLRMLCTPFFHSMQFKSASEACKIKYFY